MPVTPGGRFSPGDGDEWDLTTDLAAMQVSNEVASANEIAAQRQTYRVGTSAQRLALTGSNLFMGAAYQDTDAGKRAFVHTGSKWLPAPGSFIRLVASAQQSIGPGQQFTSWSAPGTGASRNQAGTELFTISGGVVTIVEAGVYDIFSNFSMQVGSGTVVSSLRTGGVAGAIRSQNYANLSGTYGTNVQHQVESLEVAAGTTVNIVNDVGGPLFWGAGANGTNYNAGLLSITLKQILM